MLEQQCSTWGGIISVAVYFPLIYFQSANADKLREAITRVENFHEQIDRNHGEDCAAACQSPAKCMLCKQGVQQAHSLPRMRVLPMCRHVPPGHRPGLGGHQAARPLGVPVQCAAQPGALARRDRCEASNAAASLLHYIMSRRAVATEPVHARAADD